MPTDSTLKTDPFGVRYLSAHLQEAGKTASLYRLVTHCRWPGRSIHEDASGMLYQRDLDLVCRALDNELNALIDEGSAPGIAVYLICKAVVAWLSSKRGWTVVRLPVRALEAMAITGGLGQALRRARGIPKPLRRIRALTQIGLTCLAFKDQAGARQALDLARVEWLATGSDFFNDDLDRAVSLAHAFYKAGQPATARELAENVEMRIREEIRRTGGVGSAAHTARSAVWAVVGSMERILDALAAFEDEYFRLRAFKEAAEQALSVGHGELAGQLLDQTLALWPEGKYPKDFYHLVLLLARSGRRSEAGKLAGSEQTPVQRIRLEIAHARSDRRQGRNPDGRELIHLLSTLPKVTLDKAFLPVIEELVRARPAMLQIGCESEIVAILDGLCKANAADLNHSDWGVIALGLATFGAYRRAEDAIKKALEWGPSIDDWQEIKALRRLAWILGDLKDVPGLDWIRTRLETCRNHWAQAELAYGLIRGYRLTGAVERAMEAEAILRTAALDHPPTERRLNTKGILALWQATLDPGEKVADGIGLTTSLIAEMAAGESAADQLSDLALTLACGGAVGLAGSVFPPAVEAIRTEEDPNTVARTIGFLAEAVAIVQKTETFEALATVARTIEDSYLQSEALFWLAGWLAWMQDWDASFELFREGAAVGLDSPVSMQRVLDMTDSDCLDELERLTVDIGYPTSQTAGIFSGLMLSLKRPDARRIRDGLGLMSRIAEGYDHVRFACHQQHFNALDRMPDRNANLIGYWTDALEQNRRRDAGEVWAIIGAGLPVLSRRFGNRFPKLLWKELKRSGKLDLPR